MTEQQQTALLTRLLSRLGLTSCDSDGEARLRSELGRAEEEITLYLGLEEWDSRFDGKAVELAALYARRNSAADPDARSVSVTEGGLSQRVEYGDRDAQEQAIFRSIARYRVVRL